MARTWRERWLTVGEQDVELLERLKDKERSGASATFESSHGYIPRPLGRKRVFINNY